MEYTTQTITPEYLLILDFEATCDERKQPKPQEIIEFPTLLYNVQNRAVEKTFHYYIKPDVNRQLSEFCTDLTGITQNQVANGISLEKALQEHENWLLENNLLLHDLSNECHSFVYLTCGDWDLNVCLPRQLKHTNDKVPGHFRQWLNIKKEFSKTYKTKARGMAGMLNILGLDLEGRHHSGIDDCRNIARICTQMLDDGWVPKKYERIM
eukprot:CAMPEP_0203671986 /NCGR_PEP_ID=MMETSP0090-20130426/7626_1 /ASSEMBLY_ACC=CAM_ASM_001088 /TAXON_ID=426623 /ORGANISM="Chaetoceros affinis, Strain CCMP159" /LENGTH=209 /DNA_ID=CAMNT_0050537197 /DNA_START=53 /DNA_END=682 /DNA_ORIENTATION=-